MLMTTQGSLRLGSGAFLACVSWFFIGCGPAPDRVCAPGAAIACACSDGKTGAQTCDSSGSRYGACDCSGWSGGGSGGTSKSGAAGTGGLGGSGGVAGPGEAGTSGLAGRGGAAGSGGSGTAGSAGLTGAGWGGRGGAGGSKGSGTGGSTGIAGAGGGAPGGGGGLAGAGGAAGGRGGTGAAGSGAAGATGGTTGGADGGSADAGSSDGLFALAAIYGHGTNVIGDVDGDHHVELIDVAYTSVDSPDPTEPVSVWKGHGDGTFATTPEVLTYNASQSAQVTDLNGDGRLDVLLGSQTYLGQSDDTFAAGPTFSLPSGVVPSWTAGPCGGGAFQGPGTWGLPYLGAYSGTPYYDLARVVTASPPGGTSNATGSFSFFVLSHGSVACGGVGDVDGDGNADLGLRVTTQGLTGSPSMSLVVAYGSGSSSGGAFKSATTTIATPFPSSDQLGMNLMDIDGDGKSDVVATDSSTGSCTILWNNGAGTFAQADASIPCPSYVADFDGDGRTDLLVNGTGSYILFGDGARGFGRRLNLPSVAFAVDVNSDGATDLVMTGALPPSYQPVVTYVYVSTAKTAAPLAPDIQCDATTIGSLCSAPDRL